MAGLGLGLGLGFWRGASGGASSGAALLLAAETDGLALDFTDMSAVVKDTATPANVYDGDPNSLLTYTSPSTKWVRNASGIYESGTTLRTDHDASGTPLGLRIEEARTNLFLNSRSPSTQNISVSATAYTLSFIGTGTITLSGTSTAGPLVGTGANERVTLTFTPTAGTLTLTVSGTMDFVQLEAGAFVTSPIVTAGTSVTRAKDRITLATTALPYSTTAGTMAFAFTSAATPSTVNSGVGLSFGVPGGGNNSHIYMSLSNLRHLRVYNTTGTELAAIDAGDPTNGAVNKLAGAWQTDNFAAALNGGAAVTDSLGTLSNSSTTLCLGSDPNNSTTITLLLPYMIYLPRRMSNADLQAWSAP